VREPITTELPDVRATRNAYDEVAQRYAELFARELDGKPFDRAILGVFAELIRTDGNPRVADVGCGPGRITAYLDGLGLDVFGIDLSAEMIRLARTAHPRLRFDQGAMERLALPDATLGGIVAWFSVIHTPPERMPAVLAEFARVLADGGRLLLAFQAADAPSGVQPYDHRVAPGYRWSPERMAELLAGAGFRTGARLRREPEPGERCGQGYLLAAKSAVSGA
jgi:SAM-dependent methyltransferase